MIVWSDQFETGFEKINQQHRTLIDNINLLEELLYTTNPTLGEVKSMVRLVDYLESYADIHFKGEEACMDSYQCPNHAENRKEHERFRGFIRDYKKLCELQGFKVELLKNLHQVMSKWITEHILRIDTQLKTCSVK